MSAASSGTRLRWRVVVRTEGRLDPSRPSRPLAWHLATCSDPMVADAHCGEGRRLLAVGASDPEGHCLLDGECPKCTAESASAVAHA
jgi:hypothetical protein